MATLVLGTVGRAIGGPLGGLAGTFLGGVVDRGLFGSGKAREGARLGNLGVQSAAYGEPIPRLYGRMRVAGNLVWTSGIRETRTHSGGGKRGPASNSYSYSASFAVVLAGRPIVGIDRIWADGKLLRAADGSFIYPAAVRTHLGGEDQPVDPLIAAAEGIDQAPAYRGRAYVVFDDLPLADYGNRIPNLTFEIVADAGAAIGLDVAARDLCAVAAAPRTTAGAFPVVRGLAAARGGSARRALQGLADLADLAFVDDAVRADADGVMIDLPARDLGATADGVAAAATRDTRAAAGSVPDALTIGFADTARDYQPGLQRAVRRTPPVRSEQRDFDVALDAVAAKRLAETLLRRAIAARTTGTITLPWRYAALRAGDTVRAGGDAATWRVRRWSLVGPVVELAVERLPAGDAGGARVADAGRIHDPGDAAPGPTVLHVLDLPPLSGAVPTTPRLLLAAAGASRGWRRAEVLVSFDRGASYASATTLDGAATMGSATSVLAPGTCDRWDRRSSVDVTLLSDAMWLERASEASVLAGANLALVGDEIVQFADVAALGPRRFRLSTLLRGRRATEAAAAGHAAGERFVMLGDATLGALDIPPEALGAPLLFKPVGAADASAAVLTVTPVGRALRPLAPVAVRVVRRADGGLDIGWTRRSRAGFAWLDGSDAPLGEESERYRLTVALDGRTVRDVTTAAAIWTYPAAALAADGGAAAGRIAVTVAQVSATVGPGDAAAYGADLDQLRS